MDNLVWGLPLLLFVLLCPLMMLGMGLFMWFGARVGFRRGGQGAAAAGEGSHSGHMMCGPMMMMGHGGHASQESPPSPEDVSTLRARVESLERQLSDRQPGEPARQVH